ncbi:MAG: tetratricopeptide repeat protein [Verrucomicrobiota bacterium]|jgi:uncharacterized protein
MPESLKWLKKAAKQNQPDAMQTLGQIYLNGGPGLKADGRQAFHWFLRAADQGRAGALCTLGSLFETGNGAPRNLDLATNCYRQAAEKGDAEAQMNLSRVYLQDLGVEADVVEGYKWLYLASVSGDGNATRTLLAIRERLTAAEALEAGRRVEDFERAFGRTAAKP